MINVVEHVELDGLGDEKRSFTQKVILLETFMYGNKSSTFFKTYDVQGDEAVNEKYVDINEVYNMLDVNPDSSLSASKILDKRIIVNNALKIVWYFKPDKEQCLFWDGGHPNYRLSRPINWNTFIFSFNKANCSLNIGVIQHNSRPNERTKVYQAPLPNIYSSGRICLGDVSLKPTDTIDDITKEYFNSTKTHLGGADFMRKKGSISISEYSRWIKSKTKENISVSELALWGTVEDFLKI